MVLKKAKPPFLSSSGEVPEATASIQVGQETYTLVAVLPATTAAVGAI